MKYYHYFTYFLKKNPCFINFRGTFCCDIFKDMWLLNAVLYVYLINVFFSKQQASQREPSAKILRFPLPAEILRHFM